MFGGALATVIAFLTGPIRADTNAAGSAGGSSDALLASARVLLQIPALRAQQAAAQHTMLKPLNVEWSKAGTPAQRAEIEKKLEQVGEELRVHQEKELSDLSASLHPTYVAYMKELTDHVYRPGKGAFAGAKIVGRSETECYITCTLTYQKEGQPSVLVGVRLVGDSVPPANSTPCRDGMHAYLSNCFGDGVITVYVGAFEVTVHVLKKTLEAAELKSLVEDFVDLDRLRTLPLVPERKPGLSTAAAVSAVSQVTNEPGPMGQVLLAALRAANTGDYVTAISYCKPGKTTKREFTQMDRDGFDFITEHGQLDFLEGKTGEIKERETGEGKGVVIIHLAGKTKDFGRYNCNLIKVNGEWKLDR